MGYPNEKIVIFLKLLDLYYLHQMLLNIFRGDALLTACFLINRMPSKVLQFQTPLQTLQKFFPENHIFSELDLRIFGCTTFVCLHDPSLSKLDARSCKCIFLGYSSVKKGYRCYSFEKR